MHRTLPPERRGRVHLLRARASVGASAGPKPEAAHARLHRPFLDAQVPDRKIRAQVEPPQQATARFDSRQEAQWARKQQQQQQQQLWRGLESHVAGQDVGARGLVGVGSQGRQLLLVLRRKEAIQRALPRRVLRRGRHAIGGARRRRPLLFLHRFQLLFLLVFFDSLVKTREALLLGGFS